jgi:hypothetical protein
MLPADDIISRLDLVLENRELIQNPLWINSFHQSS